MTLNDDSHFPQVLAIFMQRWCLVTLSGLALCGGFVGCQAEIELVPASGKVMIDGKPAANIAVQFLPNGLEGTSGPTSHGTSDENGLFSLQTYEGQPGAVPGKHVVMVNDQNAERPAQGQPLTKEPRVPTRYSTVSSPIALTVAQGEELLVEISSR
jgi:hypothetical protein